MSKMNCSEKSNLLSKLFLIIWVAVLLSGPVSLMLLIYFFANSIPKITMILLMIFIGIIWFIITIFLIGPYMYFKRKHMTDITSELGLREILETNMDLLEYDPLQVLPENTLLHCSAIFPDKFFDGKIGCYGNQLIRGKYNDKSFEMSAVNLVFTRNTGGQPTDRYFDGTIVILSSESGADSYVQYLFPENDKSRYKNYVLRNAKLNNTMPIRIGNSWECFSHDCVEAVHFFEEHFDWFSCINKNFSVRFIIHSHRCVLLGISEKLFEENHGTEYIREHFERTLKRILTYCVNSFE